MDGLLFLFLYVVRVPAKRDIEIYNIEERYSGEIRELERNKRRDERERI
jgi:hypothetical protein